MSVKLIELTFLLNPDAQMLHFCVYGEAKMSKLVTLCHMMQRKYKMSF